MQQIINILTKNYPDGKIPRRLINILEHEIIKDNSARINSQHQTKKLTHLMDM